MSQPLRGIVIGAGSRGADAYAPLLLEQPALAFAADRAARESVVVRWE